MSHIYIYSPSGAVRDKAAFHRGVKHLRGLGHEVEIDVPQDFPLVKLDFGLMDQVFTNLIYNAAIYTAPGSAIRCSRSTNE